VSDASSTPADDGACVDVPNRLLRAYDELRRRDDDRGWVGWDDDDGGGGDEADATTAAAPPPAALVNEAIAFLHNERCARQNPDARAALARVASERDPDDARAHDARGEAALGASSSSPPSSPPPRLDISRRARFSLVPPAASAAAPLSRRVSSLASHRTASRGVFTHRIETSVPSAPSIPYRAVSL
jgi:hypothetical protein